MKLVDIQSFRQVGKILREERERRSLSLQEIIPITGLSLQELVRIENGELLGFRQVPEETFRNAELYAQALGVALQDASQISTKPIANKREDIYIPAFLRKR